MLGVGPRFNVSSQLEHIKSKFDLCVQRFYCACLVRYIGHSFRHEAHAVTQLFSLPLLERLTQLRLQGRRGVPSGTAQAKYARLIHFGVQLGSLVTGRPNIRGDPGPVFRWGEDWFFELGSGGPGWHFQKHNKAAIDCRVQLLMNIFGRERVDPLLAIADSVQNAVEDLVGGLVPSSASHA